MWLTGVFGALWWFCGVSVVQPQRLGRPPPKLRLTVIAKTRDTWAPRLPRTLPATSTEISVARVTKNEAPPPTLRKLELMNRSWFTQSGASWLSVGRLCGDLPADQASNANPWGEVIAALKLEIAAGVRKPVHAFKGGICIPTVDIHATQNGLQPGAAAHTELVLTPASSRNSLADGLIVVRGDRDAKKRCHGHRTRQEHPTYVHPNVLKCPVVRSGDVERAGVGDVTFDDVLVRTRIFRRDERQHHPQRKRVGDAKFDLRDKYLALGGAIRVLPAQAIEVARVFVLLIRQRNGAFTLRRHCWLCGNASCRADEEPDNNQRAVHDLLGGGAFHVKSLPTIRLPLVGLG